LGRPGAAAAVAELVLAAAERRPAPDAERLEKLARRGRGAAGSDLAAPAPDAAAAPDAETPDADTHGGDA
jgi:hypothetical protein